MADDKMDKLRNLKADNQLETEDLDQVAGGTSEQTDQDGWFLLDLMKRAGMPETIKTYTGGYIEPDGSWCPVNVRYIEQKTVKPAWAALGVEMKIGLGGSDNVYFIDGKQVSRETAYMHAQKKTGVFL